jgi:hypothetical protein
MPSTTGSIVGAWTRSDGRDGSAIIFEPDGTYISIDPQNGPGAGDRGGVERGCYTVTGGAITIDLSASCRPEGNPAFDTNGTSGFSTKVGTAIPITLTKSDVLTIGGGVPLVRLSPP